jgi:hypothetical protein
MGRNYGVTSHEEVTRRVYTIVKPVKELFSGAFREQNII